MFNTSPLRVIVPRVALAVWLATATIASAAAREPAALVPQESLLCWNAGKLPDTPPVTDDSSTLQTLLELGTRLAGQPLDPEAQIGVRALEMFGLVIRCPHAFALIDAQAQPLENDPNARRIDQLKFAVIADVGQEREPFLRIIQKAVNETTNQGAANLRTRQLNGWTYQELRDTRLPKWSVIAWGFIDDLFVLTVGADVWPLVAQTAAGEHPSIIREPWYAKVRDDRAADRLIEIFVDAAEIRARLDPYLDGKASRFFSAWEAGDLRKAHWSLGFNDGALFCLAQFDLAGHTETRLYADASYAKNRLRAVVPPDSRYAVYRLPVDRFLKRFFTGLVEIQGEKARTNIREAWAELQAREHLDAERDILPFLGPHIVLHNYPPHPLHVPLAMTTLIEIRSDAARVREAVEKFGRGWQAVIQEATARVGKPPAAVVQRDSDGIWYLQFGPVAGIAWTTTDRFIITSWSPQALRMYLDKVGDAAGTR